MSKKWNIFRKKANKSDSHGTTAADEELQFQPGPPHSNEQVTRLSAVQAQHDVDPHKVSVLEPSLQDRIVRLERKTNKERSKNIFADSGEITERMNNLALKAENSDEYLRRPQQDVEGSSSSVIHSNKVTSKPNPIPKQRTLMKPGTGVLQQKFVPQGKDVSISDEYSDPFDALHQKALANKTTDGYTEPYKAQKIYYDATHESIGDLVKDLDDDVGSGCDNYQDPWDERNASNYAMEYEDPWDQGRGAATLPYGGQKWNGNARADGDKKYLLHKKSGESYDSGASSASSASPSINSRQRLVRVDHPRPSPKSSPHFDRRLILPKDSGCMDNYSEPWSKQVKFKPVDKRLIKAEPSLEELRRMSPGGHSSTGTGSPSSSGRGSPDGNHQSCHTSLDTLAGGDFLRRASSPVVSNDTPAGLHQYLVNAIKSKSRSLDMRNHPQALAAMMAHAYNPKPKSKLPKSASDDQLVGMLSQGIGLGATSNLYLHGGGEYEEPWDKSDVRHGGNLNAVSHIRSRSYELQRQSLRPFEPGKSLSCGKGSVEGAFYEQPWDRAPTNHLQSMQRFQERKLELHPAEAIITRDFDPLLPLEKQIWYHEGITRDEAETRLFEKNEGSYLVRKSESAKNSYSLSVQSLNGCIHMLLRRTRDGSWILGEFSAPFLSAPEMVAYYTRNRLKISDSECVTLSYPIADPYL